MLNKWRKLFALSQDALNTCWVVKKVDVIESDAWDQVCSGVEGENQLQHTCKSLRALASSAAAVSKSFHAWYL